mmetsp:Transcript_102658/g.329003  ORF Transcript_102658/g.329003 Transcript_102658/m.329003 type:complete len:271 (-) Transcript_102658:52-864(-)
MDVLTNGYAIGDVSEGASRHAFNGPPIESASLNDKSLPAVCKDVTVFVGPRRVVPCTTAALPKLLREPRALLGRRLRRGAALQGQPEDIHAQQSGLSAQLAGVCCPNCFVAANHASAIGAHLAAPEPPRFGQHNAQRLQRLWHFDIRAAYCGPDGMSTPRYEHDLVLLFRRSVGVLPEQCDVGPPVPSNEHEGVARTQLSPPPRAKRCHRDGSCPEDCSTGAAPKTCVSNAGLQKCCACQQVSRTKGSEQRLCPKPTPGAIAPRTAPLLQ